jgi:hypothetical protein
MWERACSRSKPAPTFRPTFLQDLRSEVSKRLRAFALVNPTRTNHATLVASFARPLRWLTPMLDRMTGVITSTPSQ